MALISENGTLYGESEENASAESAFLVTFTSEWQNCPRSPFDGAFSRAV